MSDDSAVTQTPVACPICKQSDQVIPIFYGPIKARHHARMRRGEIWPGSCFLGPEDCHCKRCDHSFATQASKERFKELRKMLSKLRESGA